MSSKDFFIKTLPLFDGGDDVGMVLSPQCFHNLNLHTDIFNHSNVHFWRAAPAGSSLFSSGRNHLHENGKVNEQPLITCFYACREYMQPGYDAMGFISCTGTNFLVSPFSLALSSPARLVGFKGGLGAEENQFLCIKMRHCWQCTARHATIPEGTCVGGCRCVRTRCWRWAAAQPGR